MLATPFRSAKELAAEIRRKKIGCLELLDLYLSRVGKHNTALNAIIATDVENARKRARAADRASIQMARLLEREYQGFVPPPDHV